MYVVPDYPAWDFQKEQVFHQRREELVVSLVCFRMLNIHET